MGVLGGLLVSGTVVAVGTIAYGLHAGLADLARAAIIVAVLLGSAVVTVICLGAAFWVGSLVADTVEQRGAQ